METWRLLTFGIISANHEFMVHKLLTMLSLIWIFCCNITCGQNWSVWKYFEPSKQRNIASEDAVMVGGIVVGNRTNIHACFQTIIWEKLKNGRQKTYCG